MKTLPLRLDQLPTEILTNIFAELDYITLHQDVRPVCICFNNLINVITTGTLGQKLFVAKERRAIIPNVNAIVSASSTTTSPSEPTVNIDGHQVSLDGNNEVRVEPKNDEAIALLERYCFEFHPCIYKFVIDYTALKADQKLNTEHIGYLRKSTGSFRPISDFPRLAKENALSVGIIASEYLPLVSNSTTPRPFLLANGAQHENLTVAQFIDTYVDNLYRWSSVNSSKGVQPLLYAYRMSQHQRSEMPREMVTDKWVLRHWDNVFYDEEKQEPKHRYRDAKIVAAVQDEQMWTLPPGQGDEGLAEEEEQEEEEEEEEESSVDEDDDSAMEDEVEENEVEDEEDDNEDDEDENP